MKPARRVQAAANSGPTGRNPLARPNGLEGGSPGSPVAPQVGSRDATVWSRGAGGGAPKHVIRQVRRLGGTPYAQKNETVILVIYGYLWLFFTPKVSAIN
jgi:hypothetical protein